MSTKAALKQRIIGLVKDDSQKLSAVDEDGKDAFDRSLASGLETYSRHRPDSKVVDIVGNGAHDYVLPTGWVTEFSGISSIEYPIGNVPATCLEADEYEIYRTPTDRKLRLKAATPAASESFRVTFTAPRTETTVPAADEEAFCNLAASYCLEVLANLFTQTSDPSIAADVVNYRSKGYEFSQRAKRLMQIYNDHLGIKEGSATTAASAVADLDIGYPGGGDRLTHPRRQRERR